jgi:hypothetical protein
MADYKTEDERARDRAKANRARLAVDEKIAITKKEKEESDLKLRKARKDRAVANKAAKDATLAANAKSATFPAPYSQYAVAPGTAIVGSATALIDGRIGSKEDVASWVAAGVGFVGAVGSALAGAPTAALGCAIIMGGGLTSATSRRARAYGEKMRNEAGAH